MDECIRESENRYGGVDAFRLIAAFLIVAIHTGPFSGISENADAVLTYGVGRIGVPFFLMVTGYFVLAKPEREKRKAGVRKTEKKLLVLYLLVTLLYLPISWYSGNLPSGPLSALKQLFFDGTFYHLWYLPGAILGIGIVHLLLSRCSMRTTLWIAAILYMIGVFGDSCYGAAELFGPLKAFYEVVFCVSSYTRNGIFLAPLFLVLGAVMAEQRCVWSSRAVWLAFLASLGVMLAEGSITRVLGWQRHNSMYLFLPLVMYFLLEGLLRINRKALPGIPNISLWIYLLHPICILVLRAAAGILGIKNLLTEYTLVFYLLVCLTSLAAAFLATFLTAAIGRLYKQYKRKGNNKL